MSESGDVDRHATTGRDAWLESLAAAEEGSEAGIDVDYEESLSGDSALGEDLPDSTTSLLSSFYEGVSENGRMYHKYKEGKYILPSDEAEKDRLDLQHEMFLKTLDYKLALAPLGPEVRQVLDIGTGTGIWAIDFAHEHPECEVLGVDLAPVTTNFVPPNCVFEVDDVEEMWTWRQKWDYIHVRMMTASFRDWPRFFEQCYENMNEGAWIEMQDTDFPLRCGDETLADTALARWAAMIAQALRQIGQDLVASKYKQLLIDAGFVDVTEVFHIWPQNPWPADPFLKDLGRWHLVNSLDGLEGYSLALLTRVMGMSPEEAQLMLVDVRKDMKDRKIHAWWPMYFVYGRKPVAQFA